MRCVAGLCWLAVCASGILGTADALRCRDASGKDVAWWTALKAPKGYIYGYIEAKQRKDGCVLLYTSTTTLACKFAGFVRKPRLVAQAECVL